MSNTRRFYNFTENEETKERELVIDGTIAEESWFDDEISPKQFEEELNAGEGDLTVWINSPGGDCIAASQIYTMLIDYKGKVTVKIDGIAASAASVIAMAGDKVIMAPTAMMMIHNPMTMAIGDHNEMAKAIEMLDEVKESIINAYEIKTGMQRAHIARLMEEETWMNAKKAQELGFCDEIMEGRPASDALEFSQKSSDQSLGEKLVAKMRSEGVPNESFKTRLDNLRH